MFAVAASAASGSVCVEPHSLQQNIKGRQTLTSANTYVIKTKLYFSLSPMTASNMNRVAESDESR